MIAPAPPLRARPVLTCAASALILAITGASGHAAARPSLAVAATCPVATSYTVTTVAAVPSAYRIAASLRPAATMTIRAAARCEPVIARYDPVANRVVLASGSQIDLGSVTPGVRIVASTPGRVGGASEEPLAGTPEPSKRGPYSLMAVRPVTGREGARLGLWTRPGGGYELTISARGTRTSRLAENHAGASMLFTGPALHGDLRWLAVASNEGPTARIDLYEWSAARDAVMADGG